MCRVNKIIGKFREITKVSSRSESFVYFKKLGLVTEQKGEKENH